MYYYCRYIEWQNLETRAWLVIIYLRDKSNAAIVLNEWITTWIGQECIRSHYGPVLAIYRLVTVVSRLCLKEFSLSTLTVLLLTNSATIWMILQILASCAGNFTQRTLVYRYSVPAWRETCWQACGVGTWRSETLKVGNVWCEVNVADLNISSGCWWIWVDEQETPKLISLRDM